MTQCWVGQDKSRTRAGTGGSRSSSCAGSGAAEIQRSGEEVVEDSHGVGSLGSPSSSLGEGAGQSEGKDQVGGALLSSQVEGEGALPRRWECADMECVCGSGSGRVCQRRHTCTYTHIAHIQVVKLGVLPDGPSPAERQALHRAGGDEDVAQTYLSCPAGPGCPHHTPPSVHPPYRPPGSWLKLQCLDPALPGVPVSGVA